MLCLNLVYHNGQHDIAINDIESEFQGRFEVLRENTKKIIFFVPIEKEVPKIDKYGKESVVTISQKIKFIDSAKLWQFHYQILSIISQM